MLNEKNQFDNNEFQKIQSLETTNSDLLKFRVFKLNVQSEEFKEVIVKDNNNIEKLLDSEKILLFIDNFNSRVWIWEGRNTSPRMKFISAELAPTIRNQYAIDYNITSIDEDDEPIEFKIILGLELEA